MTQYFLAHGVSDPAIANHEAVVAVGRGLARQSAIMAYADSFFMMGMVLVGALIATLFLRKSTASAAGAH
jgi:DHA2 family multidrug resistance protein